MIEGFEKMARKIYKKEIITKALLEMGCKMPLYKIQVRDLCQTVGVSRTTFYRSYDSVFELVEELEDRHIEGFKRIAERHEREGSSLTEYIRQILTYIRQEEAFLNLYFPNIQIAILYISGKNNTERF